MSPTPKLCFLTLVKTQISVSISKPLHCLSCNSFIFSEITYSIIQKYLQSLHYEMCTIWKSFPVILMSVTIPFILVMGHFYKQNYSHFHCLMLSGNRIHPFHNIFIARNQSIQFYDLQCNEKHVIINPNYL